MKSDPRRKDSDHDGLSDAEEKQKNTNPLKKNIMQTDLDAMLAYYYIDDETADYISTLAQLRIVSEDAAIGVNDSYSFFYKVLTKIRAKLFDLDDDLVEVCEEHKSSIQNKTDKYSFISSSLNYNSIPIGY